MCELVLGNLDTIKKRKSSCYILRLLNKKGFVLSKEQKC